MFDITSLLGFLVAASLLTLTPGVDSAMVLRAATCDGQKPAIMASIGIATGCLVWGAAVSLGLGVVLRASELAYTILKTAGAAYLTWLGLRLLFRTPAKLRETDARAPSGRGDVAFMQGLLTNLLNPKVGIFYVTFLPQFIPQGAAPLLYSFALACLHVALTLGWFALLISATALFERLLRQARVQIMLDRLTGFAFLGAGLSLATSRSS